MERTQLEHFVAVLDHGSFTGAAEQCHITQPALSHSIRALEQDVGARLFHRLAHGVRPTAAGGALEGPARRIIRELGIARSRIHEVEDLTLGTLEIASLPGLILDPLAAMIGRFREYYPSVLLKILHADSPAEVNDDLRRGRAELGFSDRVDDLPATLASEMVMEQEFAVLRRWGEGETPSSTVSIEELLDMDVVTGPRGSDVRTFLERAASERGRGFSPTIEVEHRGAALYLATAGAGVAVLPRPLATLGEAHGVHVAALVPRWTRVVHLVHREDPLSPAASALREIARSHLAAAGDDEATPNA